MGICSELGCFGDDNKVMSKQPSNSKQPESASVQKQNSSSIAPARAAGVPHFKQPAGAKASLVEEQHQQRPVLQEIVENDREEHIESVRLGVLLSIGVGILNACTYVTRGHVFASSQSGNILYLGLDLAQGNFANVTKYLFPPMMFAIGIVIAEHYKDKPDYPRWRQIPFLIEIVLITSASFLPDGWNALANPIFGLATGLQTITFRKIRRTPVATIVITGSFQNSITHLTRFLTVHDRADAFRAMVYLIIVLAYFAGIIGGAMLCPYLGHYTSLVSAGFLFFCTFIALPERYQLEENRREKE